MHKTVIKERVDERLLTRPSALYPPLRMAVVYAHLISSWWADEIYLPLQFCCKQVKKKKGVNFR